MKSLREFGVVVGGELNLPGEVLLRDLDRLHPRVVTRLKIGVFRHVFLGLKKTALRNGMPVADLGVVLRP